MAYPLHYCFSLAAHESKTVEAKEGMCYKQLCFSASSAGLRVTFGTEWAANNCIIIPTQGVYHADLSRLPVNVRHVTLYNDSTSATSASVHIEKIGTNIPKYDNI